VSGVRAAVSRAALRRSLSIVFSDSIHQPAPGLALARAGRLVDGDAQVTDLALDLLGWQHMEPADQDCRLSHGRLGTVEAVEWTVVLLMDDGAAEARALLVLGHRNDLEFGVGEGLLQYGARHFSCRPGRPLATAGEAAGEHQDVVRVVGDGKRVLPKVVEGEGGAEGRDHQVLALLDQTDGGDMHQAGAALSDHDTLADHRLLRALRLAANVAPAVLKRERSSCGRSTAQPQFSG